MRHSSANAQNAATGQNSPDFGELTEHLSHLAQIAQFHAPDIKPRPRQRALKRTLDVILSAVMLASLAPAFIVLAIIVTRDGGPAFFGHKRVGHQRKLFDCYKFRSMHPNAEALLKDHLSRNPDAAAEWQKFQKLQDDVRITKFGRFIRRLSLDELPQLINVLKGDMSFVGPRPCTPEQAHFYAEAFSYYQAMRPGITGPWQVGGRNHLTFQQRVELEADYVQNWNLWLDIVILAKTIPTILRKDQAY